MVVEETSQELHSENLEQALRNLLAMTATMVDRKFGESKQPGEVA